MLYDCQDTICPHKSPLISPFQYALSQARIDAPESLEFKQDKPLWPAEIQKGEVLWPLRFEFDVEFCFPPAEWETSRLEIDSLRAIVQAGFQPLKEKARDVALEAFKAFIAPPVREKGDVTGLHEELKSKIAEMGRIQKFIAEVEYPKEETRLDVVWRRVDRLFPP